jgi:hypothetical protein
MHPLKAACSLLFYEEAKKVVSEKGFLAAIIFGRCCGLIGMLSICFAFFA